MTRVDQDCCPKYATLKSAIAQATGTLGTNRMSGITTALRPRAILRARSSGTWRCSSRLESQPPHRQPMPAASGGIQAKVPTALMSKPRAS